MRAGSDRVELDPTRLPALSRPYTEPPAQRPWRGLFASLFAREAQCSPGASGTSASISCSAQFA